MSTIVVRCAACHFRRELPAKLSELVGQATPCECGENTWYVVKGELRGINPQPVRE